MPSQTNTSTNRNHKDATAIYVVGPSSTGKTTLCDALAKQLGLTPETYVTEVARGVMRQRGFTRTDVHTLEMQQAIADAHVARDRAARDAAEETQCGVMLSDRSALDAVVYAMLSAEAYGQALLDSPTVQNALRAYRSPRTHFVLLSPVREWLVDDGVRSLEDGERCAEMFRRMLAGLGIRYFEVGFGCRLLEERVASVRALAWI